LPHPSDGDSGKTRDQIGKVVGVSGRTIDHATKVLDDVSFEAQQDAAEIKLRAERKLGEMLREQTVKGGRRHKLHDGTCERAASLPEGVSKAQSHRWQLIAKLPEREPAGAATLRRSAGVGPRGSRGAPAGVAQSFGFPFPSSGGTSTRTAPRLRCFRTGRSGSGAGGCFSLTFVMAPAICCAASSK